MSRVYKKITRTPRIHVWKCVALALLGIITTAIATTIKPGVVVLRASLGQDARLPCGLGSVFLDGPDAYIQWSKNNKDLYRFPNENIKTGTADDRGEGKPCLESICHYDSSLLLEKVAPEDSGHYLCQIFYQASPPAEYLIDLRLVLPPGEPHIYDANGTEITEVSVGPVSLGVPIELVCAVHDDQPETIVYWKRNGIMLDRGQESRAGLLRSTVRVEHATRDELDARYECVAQNADVTDPLKIGVVIKMNLPPLSVKISQDQNMDFEAGKPRIVGCIIIGCVPPPGVTWHLGNRTLSSNDHKDQYDGNYTLSSLSLTPSLQDSGQHLICRARNDYLEGQILEDKVKIEVKYRPRCVSSRRERIFVVPGHKLLTVTCIVEASPAPEQVEWSFIGWHTIHTSVKKLSGFPNRYSSVLSWVPSESDFGFLVCRASNSLGQQQDACVYHLLDGGPPPAPRCYMTSDHPLQVQCDKGSSGGRPQIIHFELYNEEHILLLNVTEEDGHFSLPETVEYANNLSAVVYASSTGGRSESRTVRLYGFRPTVAGSEGTTTVETSKLLTVTEDNISWRDWLVPVGWLVAYMVLFNLLCFFAYLVCTYKGPLPAPEPDLVATCSDGSFHREPDITREERLVGATNITVNQLRPCQNQCAPSPPPVCRALLSCGRSEACRSTTTHSYFV